MPTRTLLPVWNIYKKINNLTAEPFETFEFIKDPSVRKDYVLAFEALNTIPGSREYLKKYAFDEDILMHFNDSMGTQILGSFGDHHSGASATRLGLNYSYLLKNWDIFVENYKSKELRDTYDATQLTANALDQYGSAYNLPLKLFVIAEEIKHKYNLVYTVDTVKIMLDDLIQEHKDEYNAKIEAQMKERFNDKVDVLKHHYKFPLRWKDSANGSALFGSPMLITEEMIKVIELKYPDYRTHIKAIQDDFSTSK